MNPSTGKLFFLGVNVAMRRRGLGSALLLAAAARNNNIVMLNVDDNDYALNSLLEKAGLQRFISQYEMEWKIPA
ncbi:MAG: GNAT family N-acetyltransferase [Dinghuibacter sp.]|nr:GNAT family N-acetyltransferase [Dinghuibacter sp.]